MWLAPNFSTSVVLLEHFHDNTEPKPRLVAQVTSLAAACAVAQLYPGQVLMTRFRRVFEDRVREGMATLHSPINGGVAVVAELDDESVWANDHIKEAWSALLRRAEEHS